jgi:hypothetical protein
MGFVATIRKKWQTLFAANDLPTRTSAELVKTVPLEVLLASDKLFVFLAFDGSLVLVLEARVEIGRIQVRFSS